MTWPEQFKVRPSGLFELALILSGVGTLAGFCGAWGWRLDLFAHFRLQYLIVLLVAAAVFFVRRRRGWGIAALVLACPNLALMRWSGGATAEGPGLRVMLLNVNTQRGDPAQVVRAIQDLEPELVLLLEVDEAWVAHMDAAFPDRHALRHPRPDNFGLMLLSRTPLDRARVLHLGEAGVPSVEVRLDVDGHEVRLLGTHTLPPASSRGSRLRDQQLVALAERVNGVEGPLLLLGDLNATPWSHAHRRLRAATGLRNASGGLATWPSHLPWPLRIPIDGALVRGEVALRGASVGPHVGSDHRPLVFELLVP